MADTIRTLAELQSMFAPNTSGDISSQDILDWLITQASTNILQTKYRDQVVSAFSMSSGTDAPDLEIFRGSLYGLAFAGSGGVATEQTYFAIHIQHDYKVGTDITLHVHWGHKIASPTGNAKWFIDYSVARGYGAGTFPAASTLSSTQAAPAQYVHAITPDADMTIPSSVEIEPDSIILCRLYRTHGDAADTFGGDAFVFSVDAHYQCGQYATDERNRPFTSAGF